MSLALALLLLVAVLLALRQNVVVILGTALACAWLYQSDGDLRFIALDAWEAANRDLLLSIPLFILAGAIMGRGGIASRLVRLMRAVTAPVPGGLAIATVLSCALFAAVSGSGTVTLLAIGTVMYPALRAAGYRPHFALGALCAGSTLGIVIPPSIPLILYGVMTHTSITDLFLAGIGPGLLLTLLLSAYAAVSHRHLRSRMPPAIEIARALREGILALMMPVVILGGIYSGHFTATESAAVAVVYAVVVEIYIHRELRWRDLVDTMTDTARILGALFPVLMLAFSLNVLLTYQQVPEMLVARLGGMIDTPIAFILATNIVLLALGCLVDIGSAILILAPLLQPLAAAQGVDPVHLGILMTVNLEIGYLTPPFGLNLIVAVMAFGESFAMVCRAVVPFVLLMLAGLVIVSLWPPLSLFLVR